MAFEFWNRDRTLKLIELWKEAKCLWETVGHKAVDKQERMEAHENMGKALGCDSVAIEKKIHSLLSQYRREQIRINKKIEEGSEPNDIYETAWFGYKLLNFLDKKEKRVISRSVRESNKEENHKKTSNNNYENGPTFIKVECSTKELSDQEEQDEYDDYYADNQNFSVDEESKSGGDRKRLASDDECSIFGELLAVKLRKLDPLTRIELQHKIDNLMYETEREVLRNNLRRPL